MRAVSVTGCGGLRLVSSSFSDVSFHRGDMARKKFDVPVRFAGAEGHLPGLVQAASLALEIMRHVKVAAWSDLPDDLFVNNGSPGPKVALDETQAVLLSEHFDVVVLLSPSGVSRGGARVKQRSVAVCEKCGRWVLASGKSAVPKRCVMSEGCTGLYVNVVRLEKLFVDAGGRLAL